MDIFKTMTLDLIINGIAKPLDSSNFKLETQTHIIDSSAITKVRVFYANNSDSETIINKSLLVFELNEPINRVLYQKSAWCNENQTVSHPIGENLHIFSSGTRTTQDFNPFTVIYTESQLFSFHILPVGDWEILVDFHMNGKCRIFLGLKSSGLALKVPAHAQIELPSVILQVSDTPMESTAAMAFHEYLNKFHFMATKEIPVPFNSWFYDFDKFKDADLRNQAVKAKDLGMDVFIVDAGWYGPSNDDWAMAAGDWREKTNGGFYGEMKQFSDYIISLDMQFGLWIEPERICMGTPVLENHPEYFIKAPNGSFYPDLSRPEPVSYIYKTISSLIERYNVSWLKLDFNFSLGDDSGGSNFYLYIKGLYGIMDRLRTSYPYVIFEGCESGAMRFDLESARFYDVHFLSDNVNPVDALEIFKNSAIRMSPSILYKWIVAREIHPVPKYGTPIGAAPGRLIVPKGATWDNFESADISFLFCLALSGYPGFSGDISSFSADNSDIIKRLIKAYKTNRTFFSNCCSYIYNADEISPGKGWTVYQLVNKSSSKTFLFCFRLDSDYSICDIKLENIDVSQNYLIENVFGETDIIPGKAIFNGFRSTLGNKFTASLYIISPE